MKNMININGNYDELIENNLKDELSWLEEEFSILFKSKKKEYTKKDFQCGSMILHNVIDHIKTNKSEELLHLLAITLTKIEQSYPDFF